MSTVSASLSVLDRDTGVLIPGEIQDPNFVSVEVELDEELELKDIELPNVAMLQRESNGLKLRFIQMDREKFYSRFDSFIDDGWLPMGYDLMIFFQTLSSYEESLPE